MRHKNTLHFCMPYMCILDESPFYYRKKKKKNKAEEVVEAVEKVEAKVSKNSDNRTPAQIAYDKVQEQRVIFLCGIIMWL